MIAVAKGCDIAINPIHSSAMQTITNKLSDYMALGKPIFNSQEGEEVREILTLLPHEHYQSGQVDSFIKAAQKLMDNKLKLSSHEKKIAQHFDRKIAYQKMINMIETMSYE